VPTSPHTHAHAHPERGEGCLLEVRGEGSFSKDIEQEKESRGKPGGSRRPRASDANTDDAQSQHTHVFVLQILSHRGRRRGATEGERFSEKKGAEETLQESLTTKATKKPRARDIQPGCLPSFLSAFVLVLVVVL